MHHLAWSKKVLIAGTGTDKLETPVGGVRVLGGLDFGRKFLVLERNEENEGVVSSPPTGLSLPAQGQDSQVTADPGITREMGFTVSRREDSG